MSIIYYNNQIEENVCVYLGLGNHNLYLFLRWNILNNNEILIFSITSSNYIYVIGDMRSKIL